LAIDAQGDNMVAHCVASAKDLRAELADGEVLLAKPDTCSTSGRLRFRWKWAYRARLSSQPLESSLRGLLQWILEHSDEFGRLWWGQTRLADKMKCTTKTVRRYFAKLVHSGFLRVEKHSFKSLTAAQKKLRLPPPDRNDEGRAPNVLTLLVDGEDAFSYAYAASRAANVFEGVQSKMRQDKPRPGIARAVPPSDFVPGEPRTKLPEIPRDKMTDDPLDSAFLTSKVEGDLEPCARPILVDEPKTFAPQNNSPPQPEAWRVLNAAYDAQYRRVYHSTPTKKCMTADDKQSVILHIEEMTGVFESKLRDADVDLTNLSETPMKLLVDEALRAWFDGSGTNDFLRRVSHRMRELVADLPHRVRKAMATLLEKYSPKPAPHASTEDYVSPGIHLILNGLSVRPQLREFAQNESFARELEAMARERGLGSAHVLVVLDGLARVAERLKTSTPQMRKNAVFAAAIEVFGETNDRLERCES
jgi:hypothetical protein